MHKNLTITSFLGLLVIVFGAFGAHALKKVLSIDEINSFETAVRYQMYHVIILLFVNTYTGFTSKVKKHISWSFFIGILLFSGSIYLMHLTSISAKQIWFITPLGGLTFVYGWFIMAIKFLKSKSTIKS